ncbi:uncharacterized protein J3D65DRAFT_635471 [Phyllosticta citribraziliensis]|uniref:Zn(2)-C6 fungal-type domain-containing protein n=1 Tax=Phyllosticta citribraziliensis TaxID=989973 RepID=A0ABR1LDW0_9PEZI
MVGVPKSTACATCKSRKIRCDQKWPTCERCQRSGLDCPGPSNPHAKFVDERPRHYRASISSDDEPSSPAASHAPCTSLEPIRTRYEHDGSMYSTFRIVREGSSSSEGSPTSESEEATSPALSTRVQSPPRRARPSPPPRWVYPHRQLPWSPVDRITHRFVKTLREQGASNQMTLFGPFIAQVPTRLGSTRALRDAAQCLIATHEAVILRKSGDGINLELYVKALGSLRAAIINPVKSELTSTLCASALLAITEAYAVGTVGTNRNFVTHLGGAASILQKLGPGVFKNAQSFERGVLRAITVGVGLDALFGDKDDILCSPEWEEVAFDTTGLQEPRLSLNKLMRAMSFLPSLSHDMRACEAGSTDPHVTPACLYRRALALRVMVDEVTPYILETLKDHDRVLLLPSDACSIWKHAFFYSDYGTAFACWFYWNMSMVALSIVIGIHRRPHWAAQLGGDRQPDETIDQLERECVEMAQKTAMSWEHAMRTRPLGTMYHDFGLIMAFNVFGAYGSSDAATYSAGELQDWCFAALKQLAYSNRSPRGYSRSSTPFFAAPDHADPLATQDSSSDNMQWNPRHLEWFGAWCTGGCLGRCDVPDPRNDVSRSAGRDADNAKDFLVLPPNGLRIPWPSTRRV